MALPNSAEAFKMHTGAMRECAQRFPSIRSILEPNQPVDMIALDLPWGVTRHFNVPAVDPNNPRFQIFPRRKTAEPEEITLDKVRYTREWR
ncbi:hypothetical protein I6F11_04100 [Ensifer sp. NBAIM29]|nr:hypothetical protein [Ensifer sp. NBAIM29]